VKLTRFRGRFARQGNCDSCGLLGHCLPAKPQIRQQLACGPGSLDCQQAFVGLATGYRDFLRHLAKWSPALAAQFVIQPTVKALALGLPVAELKQRTRATTVRATCARAGTACGLQTS
jgi:hypothetical protein